jgi:NitT/TauT family transport system substrate-binding protein
VAALSQHMYWFLVVRSDLNIGRGELGALREIRIGAAPGPDLGLRLLLADAGIDVEARGIHIGPVPASEGTGTSFGVAAAQALETRSVDGFWANGMGAELAVRRGTGTLLLDARRGDGPAGASDYTFPALAVTEHTIERAPDAVAAVTRAIIRAQRLLRADPQRATEAVTGLFPALETSMIAELVRRDAPFYDPAISADSARQLARFGRRTNLITTAPACDQLVTPHFRHLWQ